MISIPSLFRNIIQSRKNRIFVSNRTLSRNEKEAILLLPGFGVTFFGTTKMADFFLTVGMMFLFRVTLREILWKAPYKI